MTQTLRIARYKKDGYHIAHCLDLDILTSSNIPQTLDEDIKRVCEAQIRYALDRSLSDHLYRKADDDLLEQHEKAQKTKGERFIIQGQLFELEHADIDGETNQ